jgi:hypothetical protein
MGFAIKKRTPESEVTSDTPINYYLWQAYTDDGMTYSIVNKQGRTLKDLKQQIKQYRSR